MSGYVVVEFKSTTNPKRIPRSIASAKVFHKIAEFPELALGVTHLDMELGWDAPAVKPTNIKTEWRKADGTDPTGRHGHEVGTERAGASTGGGKTEDVSAVDNLISLWIWHDAPRTTPGTGPDPASDLLMTKVIAKAHNPKAEIAGDLA